MSSETTKYSRDAQLESGGASVLNLNGQHRPRPHSAVRYRPADPDIESRRERRVTVAGTAITVVEALAVALEAQGGFVVTCVTATGGDLPGLVAQDEADEADVLVLYLPRLEPSWMHVISELKTALPNARLVLLVAEPDIQLLARAAAGGVSACLSLDTGLYDLVGAINTRTAGAMIVGASSLWQAGPGPRASTAEPAGPRGPDGPDEDVMGLTPRELEVLTLMADGCGGPAIASRLVISIYTARGHIKNVLRKLDAHSQLEAVATARRLGLLPGGVTAGRRFSGSSEREPSPKAGR